MEVRGPLKDNGGAQRAPLYCIIIAPATRMHADREIEVLSRIITLFFAACSPPRGPGAGACATARKTRPLSRPPTVRRSASSAR